MNERIRELAEQAGMGFGKPFKQTEDTLYIKSDKVADAIATDAGTHQEQVLKFAELIVRECIKLCDGNHEYKNNTDTLFGGGIAAGVEICKTQIAQHFGVEE